MATRTRPGPSAPARSGRKPWPGGLTILEARPLTAGELAANGWVPQPDAPAPIGIFLSDGSVLTASENLTGGISRSGRPAADYRPGTLVGVDVHGRLFRLAAGEAGVPQVVRPTRVSLNTFRRLAAVGATFDLEYVAPADTTVPPTGRRSVISQSGYAMTTQVVGGRRAGERFTLNWADVMQIRGDDGRYALYDRLGEFAVVTNLTPPPAKSPAPPQPSEAVTCPASSTARSRRASR